MIDGHITGVTRYALCLEYNGSAYCGWQSQRDPHQPTVQETLELALSSIAAQPVVVQCAGRTDTGVHASGQVVHFDCSAQRAVQAWTLGVNARLPRDIAVRWARAVDTSFHARFSALYRRYRYLILNRDQRTANGADGCVLIRQPLDAGRMHAAAQALLGEQDFSSFRAAGCQSRTAMRRVEAVSVCRQGAVVVIDIQANAFLLHMVRNIAGALIAVGKGEQEPDWIATLLAGKDRRLAAPTAPAQGLYLVEVGYPEPFGLPRTTLGPWFLPEAS